MKRETSKEQKDNLILFLQFAGAIAVGLLMGLVVNRYAGPTLLKMFVYLGTTLLSSAVFLILTTLKNLTNGNDSKT